MIEFTIKKSYLKALKKILKLRDENYATNQIKEKINIVSKSGMIYFAATNRHVLAVIYEEFKCSTDFNSQYLFAKDKFFNDLGYYERSINRAYSHDSVLFESNNASIIIMCKTLSPDLCKNTLFELINGKEQSPA